MLTRAAGEDPIVDLLGIGFGPSNLAIAIAVIEYNATHPSSPITAAFLEKQLSFGWHRGMLLDGATMQVSFLKDLATLRNPVSPFGFISYLHARNRLAEFINHKVLYPSRIEFHDYLEWCAAGTDHLVRYGHEAVSARPVEVDGLVTHHEVLAHNADGEPVTTLARNLVVAPGLSPRLPDGVSPSRRVWHSSTLLHGVRDLDGASPRRFVVFGAGQSAAEATGYLHHAFPASEVVAAFSRYGYSQSDDSPMANRVFDPAAVDSYYAAPDDVKAAFLRYHANTNYSVVDADLIGDLYRRWYQERVVGTSRLRLVNMASLGEVRDTPDGVTVVLRDTITGRDTSIDADVLVCATGYRPADPLSLLGETGKLLWTDDRGRLVIDRDYRVATDPDVVGSVYLCGGTEHSHGISSSLLSNAAVRAGEILDSVLDRTALATRRGPSPADRCSIRPESS